MKDRLALGVIEWAESMASSSLGSQSWRTYRETLALAWQWSVLFVDTYLSMSWCNRSRLIECRKLVNFLGITSLSRLQSWAMYGQIVFCVFSTFVSMKIHSR